MNATRRELEKEIPKGAVDQGQREYSRLMKNRETEEKWGEWKRRRSRDEASINTSVCICTLQNWAFGTWNHLVKTG